MVLDQIGDGHDEAYVARLHLHHIGTIDDDRLAVRERVDHGDPHRLGIFLDDRERFSKERTNDKVKLLALDLAQRPLGARDIVGHVKDLQVELQTFSFEVLSRHHEAFIELQERQRTRLLCLGHVFLGDIEFAHLAQIERHHQSHLIALRGVGGIGDALLRSVIVLVKEHTLRLWLRFGFQLLRLFHFDDFDGFYRGVCRPIEIRDGVDGYQNHLT